MNCKNCRNWVFGRCVVSNFIVGPGQLCNAWELSQSHEMVTMPFATFDEEELHKRIMELEYKASDNASSIHAIISVLDVDNETEGYSHDMFDTALELAHKLRTRVAQLELELNNTKFHAEALQQIVDERQDEIVKLEISDARWEENVIVLNQIINNLRQLLTDLELQLCWIPVSERLPELDQDVFAIVEGDIDRGHFYESFSFDGEIYFSSDTRGAMSVATHWMNIPDLPEEVQE